MPLRVFPPLGNLHESTHTTPRTASRSFLPEHSPDTDMESRKVFFFPCHDTHHTHQWISSPVMRKSWNAKLLSCCPNSCPWVPSLCSVDNYDKAHIPQMSQMWHLFISQPNTYRFLTKHSSFFLWVHCRLACSFEMSPSEILKNVCPEKGRRRRRLCVRCSGLYVFVVWLEAVFTLHSCRAHRHLSHSTCWRKCVNTKVRCWRFQVPMNRQLFRCIHKNMCTKMYIFASTHPSVHPQKHTHSNPYWGA